MNSEALVKYHLKLSRSYSEDGFVFFFYAEDLLMKHTVSPKKVHHHDAEEIFLDVCKVVIALLLIGVLGYSFFL
ncbi:hypothetical protein [Kangiella shandongensis]|uniref:hypothetical protein n=1 Tax=Kangiella shandongensis TaxID=2763258 RepID=UPI001CC0E117|nr:hypothetical protein [Kangiella shandongensis]